MEEKHVSGATIRRLWSADREAFRAHLLRLDPQSRHERFHGGTSDEFLSHYADDCFRIGDVIFGAFVDGELRGAGELRPDRTGSPIFPLVAGPRRAEAAFSVEHAYRRLGLGEALFARLVRAAGNHGVETIDLTCQADNKAMQNLARKFTAELHFNADQITGRLTARRPTPFSLWREASSDAGDFAVAMIDRAFSPRNLRP